MIAKNITKSELQDAMNRVNAEFDNNIQFNRLEQKGNAIHFTIRVADSKGPGAKYGFTGRRTVSACWHVHGMLFDAILDIQPKGHIKSAVTGDVYKNEFGDVEGNWKDFNCGSIMYPMYASEMCYC